MHVDLYTQDIPEIFERFQEAIGERHWIKRVAAIKSEIKGQPYLRDYLLEENAIAFVLDKCSALASRYGRIPPQHTNDRASIPRCGSLRKHCRSSTRPRRSGRRG